MRTLTPQHARRDAARPRRLLAVVCISGFVLGCAPPTPSPARLPTRVHARSPEGQDVAGVRLWADGRQLGTTDAAGRLDATLEAREGTRVVITAACPSTYRTVDERRELVMRPLRAASADRTAAALQLSVTCEPLELVSALVVRVRGDATAGLPVRVRDRVVGQTGPDGTAHVLLRTRPDASLTVQLDTSTAPGLEPRSPVQTFQLGQQPGVLVFDQTLARSRPARRGARPLRPALPASHRLPYRVD